MALETWLAFVVAVSGLLVTPGPTLLLVTSLTVVHGRRALWALVPGVCLADVLFVSMAVLGLGLLVAQVPWLYWSLRLFGLAYLLYMAVGMWRSPPPSVQVERGAQATMLGLFTRAFLVTISNPKGFVFLLGFLPNFYEAEAPTFPQAPIMAGTFFVLSIFNSTTWGLAAGALRARLLAWPHMGKVGACLLIVAAAYILVDAAWLIFGDGGVQGGGVQGAH